MATLSPTMQAAVDLAKQNGNKLARYSGGFWAGANWQHGDAYASTRTVDALVQRKVATYTDHRSNSQGQFPIEITLT